MSNAFDKSFIALTEARATIERLQEERDSAYVKLRCVSTENAALIADGRKQFRRFIEQRAENAALLVDAERWRFLLNSGGVDVSWHFASQGNLTIFDSAGVDAARAQAEKEG